MHLELPTSAEISRLPDDGGEEFNRLIFESSPYLLQHARNPIEWRAWGDEALALAVSENKPIFLSIGYTTCHWCHVMERESFEDEEVAHLLNQDYICIKVDREERPDLDHVYMAVTQMMTGRGGWPMTVIMTPEKVPFFAGTYFPKSSMLDLLPHFARVWKEEKGKVSKIGQTILHNLSKSRESQSGGDLNANHLDRCFEVLSVAYDPVYGGFGNQPKFPTPHALSYLLRYYQRTGEPKALEMVTHTLTQIRLSGTYDQIGWGIHRYSTDQEWLVPHFEKMLYDQALYSIACIEAYQITKNPFFREACENTLTYVERDLSDPMGGFYSAEDADSEGEEGKFYVWSINEIEEILSEKETNLFTEVYRFQGSGNFLDESSGQKTGSNIPHLSQPLTQLAESKREEPKKFTEQIERIREKLFQARKKRIHPQLDDKVLTDWNGLMISAFAKAAQSLDSQSYLDRARKAADFCLTELRQKNGRLYKRWRQGKAGLPAHLEDYAFLIQGLLDLYEASLDPVYLLESKELTDLTRTLFEDLGKGGFFLTAHDGEKLLTRPKEIYDGAIPSGNSIMALNLARLWKITGNKTYEDCLNSCFSAFSGFLESNPSGAENFLHALAFVLQPPAEIVVAGNPDDKTTTTIIEAVHQKFLPFKTLLHLSPDYEHSKLVELAPYSSAFAPIEKSTFYLCRDQACEQPKTEIHEIMEVLDDLSKPPEDK